MERTENLKQQVQQLEVKLNSLRVQEEAIRQKYKSLEQQLKAVQDAKAKKEHRILQLKEQVRILSESPDTRISTEKIEIQESHSFGDLVANR